MPGVFLITLISLGTVRICVPCVNIAIDITVAVTLRRPSRYMLKDTIARLAMA